MKWYLVCYLGMGNTISVCRLFNSLDEATEFMKHDKTIDVVYFILETVA